MCKIYLLQKEITIGLFVLNFQYSKIRISIVQYLKVNFVQTS